MKEVREIVTCTVPFIIAAMLVYPFMAIVGADFDPFMWSVPTECSTLSVLGCSAGLCLYVWTTHVRSQCDRGRSQTRTGA